ncbi:hypothetical protein HDU92_006147 [Lobulomyces angularis]|nr:hypothetical protein HDU92_006147 [Lobulomyces angularis]
MEVCNPTLDINDAKVTHVVRNSVNATEKKLYKLSTTISYLTKKPKKLTEVEKLDKKLTEERAITIFELLEEKRREYKNELREQIIEHSLLSKEKLAKLKKKREIYLNKKLIVDNETHEKIILALRKPKVTLKELPKTGIPSDWKTSKYRLAQQEYLLARNIPLRVNEEDGDSKNYSETIIPGTTSQLKLNNPIEHFYDEDDKVTKHQKLLAESSPKKSVSPIRTQGGRKHNEQYTDNVPPPQLPNLHSLDIVIQHNPNSLLFWESVPKKKTERQKKLDCQRKMYNGLIRNKERTANYLKMSKIGTILSPLILSHDIDEVFTFKTAEEEEQEFTANSSLEEKSTEKEEIVIIEAIKPEQVFKTDEVEEEAPPSVKFANEPIIIEEKVFEIVDIENERNINAPIIKETEQEKIVRLAKERDRNSFVPLGHKKTKPINVDFAHTTSLGIGKLFSLVKQKEAEDEKAEAEKMLELEKKKEIEEKKEKKKELEEKKKLEAEKKKQNGLAGFGNNCLIGILVQELLKEKKAKEEEAKLLIEKEEQVKKQKDVQDERIKKILNGDLTLTTENIDKEPEKEIQNVSSEVVSTFGRETSTQNENIEAQSQKEIYELKKFNFVNLIQNIKADFNSKEATNEEELEETILLFEEKKQKFLNFLTLNQSRNKLDLILNDFEKFKAEVENLNEKNIMDIMNFISEETEVIQNNNSTSIANFENIGQLGSNEESSNDKPTVQHNNISDENTLKKVDEVLVEDESITEKQNPIAENGKEYEQSINSNLKEFEDLIIKMEKDNSFVDINNSENHNDVFRKHKSILKKKKEKIDFSLKNMKFSQNITINNTLQHKHANIKNQNTITDIPATSFNLLTTQEESEELKNLRLSLKMNLNSLRNYKKEEMKLKFTPLTLEEVLFIEKNVLLTPKKMLNKWTVSTRIPSFNSAKDRVVKKKKENL